jgi:hypothetical protein
MWKILGTNTTYSLYSGNHRMKQLNWRMEFWVSFFNFVFSIVQTSCKLSWGRKVGSVHFLVWFAQGIQMCWLKWLGESRILLSVNLEELLKVRKVYILTIYRELFSNYCANLPTISFSQTLLSCCTRLLCLDAVGDNRFDGTSTARRWRHKRLCKVRCHGKI